MKTTTYLQSLSCAVVLVAACLIVPLFASTAAANPYLFDRLQPPAEARAQLAQARQCSRRAGPFATQDTAWARWRQARNQGLAVSQGVVPCYDAQGTRGYCFYVFYPC